MYRPAVAAAAAAAAVAVAAGAVISSQIPSHTTWIMDGENRIILNVGGIRYVNRSYRIVLSTSK